MRSTPRRRPARGGGLSCGGLVGSCGVLWGRLGAPSVLGTRPPSPYPGALAGTTGRTTETAPGINSIAREGNPGQAASVGGPSNQELKRTPGHPRWRARARPGGGQAQLNS